MTATYDPALLTDIDRMREVLGDTDVQNPLAEDETYQAKLILASGSWKLAAASMARSFASRAINDITSFSAGGDISVSWADRASAWLKLATSLEAEAARDAAPAEADNTLWSAGVVRRDVKPRGEYSKPLYDLGYV